MKDLLEKYLISKIDEIHANKKGKISPDYVLYVELMNSINSDIKGLLNKFYKEKRYKIGKTLNDKYIMDKKWEENDV
jgi:hypothetical protein